MQNNFKIGNEKFEPIPKECVNKYKNETWKCMFAENLIEFIRVIILK